MICLSCGNKFLQPFVCTICFYNVRSAEAARPQMEVLENENAVLQEMLEKCNSKFIVGLDAENAELREELVTIRAATVEECARVCEERFKNTDGGYSTGAYDCAEKIRALLTTGS